MKTVSIVVLVISAACCASLLTLSLWPGTLDNLFLLAVLTAVFWVPLAGIGAFVLLALAVRMVIKGAKGSRASLLRLVVAGAVLLLSLALVLTHIPLRLAFTFGRPFFEQWVESAPASQYGGEALNRRIGMWRVDEYAADPRGGVYFRVGTGPDGLGPDTMSYGFALKPNPEGSPFGNAHYRRSRLTGEWFYFRASDDY
jgi:hypothetical protein